MNDSAIHTDVTRWLVQWAEARPAIRAVILTSSRTNPQAPLDVLSDYDVIMVVTDVRAFYDDKSYLDDYGRVLAIYKNPFTQHDGFDHCADITQYEDGTKIDYCFSPVAWLRWLVDQPELPPDIDLGYAVLLDKDGLTAGLKPPSHRAFIPSPPTEAEYLEVIEGVFHEATYVAKHLWRDDLIAAKYNLDYYVKFKHLRAMLEWHMEIDHGWAVKTGAYGRGLKRQVRPAIWAAFEETYVGADLDENWDAMFKTLDLFRQVAIEVGDHLGYAYPEDHHQRVIAYLRQVQQLDRQAQTFS